MTIDIIEILQIGFTRQFEYRVAKGDVLKIDTKNHTQSVPKSIAGGANGELSLSGTVIYYSPKDGFSGKDEFYYVTSEDNKDIVTKVTVDVVSTFKPKAHILVLLGEELIKSPVMAIYELIKNAYDADSPKVEVNFIDIENPASARIEITDNGTGITKEVLENVWFEPGTDFRKPIKEDGTRQIKRSPINWRIPMGEKGVGRFAVHKLGHTISLISRPALVEVDELGKAVSTELLDYEIEVFIDWRSFSQSKYLEDVKIDWRIKRNSTDFYFKETHGTKIVVENLKETWTRGMARQLKRNTISMLSPKNDPNKFEILLDFGNWWLSDFPDFDEILEAAPYKLTAFVDENFKMTFDYAFQLQNNSDIGSRLITEKIEDPIIKTKYERNIKGEIKPFYRKYLQDQEINPETIDALISNFDSELNKLLFGKIMVEIYSYDLDSISLRDYTETPSVVKGILKEHAGIKVFKGDLRVYDYGDPGNDWLGLDIKRVNNKTWFSNNQNIGFIFLDDESSGGLIEKTNREGFIKNVTFDHFIILLEFILSEFKTERLSDRERWLRFNKKGSNNSLESQIDSFKEIVNNTDLDNQEKKQLLLEEAGKIEERYKSDKETLLIPAGVGMTASFAMHEIEKLVPRMEETLNDENFIKDRIVEQVDELKDYVEGILSVVKRGGNKPIILFDAITQAIKNYAVRLKNWKISIEIDHDAEIETIKCDKRLFITMLMNVLDNSIYWLDTIYKPDKGIYIKTSKVNNGVSILIVDNGPGFKDNIEDIISPFFTRKEGGIGIGMYLIDTVMLQYGKLNIIYDANTLTERGVPEKYSGAAVELVFSKIL